MSEWEDQPKCDLCSTELIIHGDTFSGACCDIGAAIDDIARAALIGVFGEDAYWERWYTR